VTLKLRPRCALGNATLGCNTRWSVEILGRQSCDKQHGWSQWADAQESYQWKNANMEDFKTGLCSVSKSWVVSKVRLAYS